MAKNIKFVLGGSTWESGIVKLDREKVYGWVEEVVFDDKGNPCSVASLLDDGSTLILSGMMAFKTLTTEGSEVNKKELVAVNLDGSPAQLMPSVFDEEVVLKPATLEDLLNLEVKSIYQLSFDDPKQKEKSLEALSSGKLLQFLFNYRTDYEADNAVLLSAQNEIFILTGSFIDFPYLSNSNIIVEDLEADETDDDDLDFGLL